MTLRVKRRYKCDWCGIVKEYVGDDDMTAHSVAFYAGWDAMSQGRHQCRQCAQRNLSERHQRKVG